MDRSGIQQANLIPPGILQRSQADVQFPFLVMREVFIDRLYRQKVGYWGPRLEGVDQLSEAEIGKGLVHYPDISEDQFALGFRRMIAGGDFELAARTVDWALTCFPRSVPLQENRNKVFLQLA